jgi:phospholipid-translocating ATPase
LALTVCHNVTPITNEIGEKEYQASSPDEVALVKIAESMGMVLKYRDQGQMVIQNAAGEEEVYEILNIFPFSSDSKRMGILVRHKST